MGKANKPVKAKVQKTKTDKAVAVACIVFAVLIAGTLIFTAVNESGIFLRLNNVVENDGAEIDAAMLSFFFNNNIVNWYNQYGGYLSLFSVDVTKDLHGQKFNPDGSYDAMFLGAYEGDWYGYFMNSALEEAKMYVACADKAAKEGIELTKEELDNIDADVKELKESFRTSGLSFSDWFGNGVTESVVRECYKLMSLRDKYQKHKLGVIEDSINAETNFESINKHISENKGNFYSADVLKYAIKVSGKGLTDKQYEEKVAAAKAAAEAIINAGKGDAKEFIAAIDKYEASQKTETKKETETVDAEKEFESKVDKYKENHKYVVDTSTETESGTGTETETEQIDVDEWLFEEEASEGDVMIYEESETVTEKVTTSKDEKTETETEDEEESETKKASGNKDDKKTISYKTYTVTAYYVYRENGLNNDLTHDFAFLICNDKAEVEKFIEAFKKGDKTVDAFYDLAEKSEEAMHSAEGHQHSADEQFLFNKVEKVNYSAFVNSEEFGSYYKSLDNWVEDDARKDGDMSDIITVKVTSSSSSSTSPSTTKTYYAFLFFSKHNVPTWQANGLVGAQNDAFKAWFEEECKSIKVDENGVANIPTTIQAIVTLYSGY